jgi:hypothetical protein
LAGSSISKHGIRLRDDFTQRTIADTAKAVGYRCSNPDCQRLTVGSNAEHDGVINLGVAAHITAASPGGPRYDDTADAETRKGKDNCIWLCQDCAKLIDSNPEHFTVTLLQDWKHGAEKRTFRELVAPQRRPGGAEEAAKKIEAALGDAAGRTAGGGALEFEKIRQAALTDLAGFKRMAALPDYAVALNLRVHGDKTSPSFTIERLPSAIDVAHEVCIIAPPGTGKTTTLLQLADAVLASNKAIALFVRLGEWSTQSSPIMTSISERRAFKSVDPSELTRLADEGRLVLLLDGWNELDVDSRSRLRAELTKMRRELPELRIVISTRRQALDVPVSGPKVDVEALSENQQLQIARGVSGATGEHVLDQARRTPGVRSLISTPLYLTSLLKGAPSGALPTTKEEILRMFVQEQERMAEHEEPLHTDLLGCHERFLTALAVEATQTANTAISDFRARAVVTTAEDALVSEGQINERLEPKTVLEVLVSHHTLISTGADEGGVSFQHQQFEEWYASFEVERAMRASAAADDAARRHLRVDILNQPAWEESILFACERVSRMAGGADIVGAAVLLALAIDPMLAAEMIYRSDAAAWDRVSTNILAFANRWHRAGAADRAARFMVMTGRPEFAPTIWPLATSEDSQVQPPVLRNPPRFRPSVLGTNIRDRVGGLPEEVRKNLLSTLVFEGGFDGIDLASEIAKTDPSPAVQFAVVEALLFRRAERHATELLNCASGEVWPLLAQKGYADELSGDAAERMSAERRKLIENEQNPLRRASFILNFAIGTDADSTALADSIASPDFPARDQNAAGMLHRSFRNYPGPIAQGLLRRLEAGLEIPFRTEDLLTDVPSIDDGAIAAGALDPETERKTGHVAARIVGPKTTGSLIDIYLDVNKSFSTPEGRTDRALADRYDAIRRQINTTRASSFVPAILSHHASNEPRVIGALARLVAQHGSEDEDRKKPLPLGSDQIAPFVSMVRGWVDALIPLADSDPHLVAEVASAVGRVGRVELIPDLRRLLDADLARLQKETQGGRRRGARTLCSNQYSIAFARIDGDAIVPVVSEYLENHEFGFMAGVLLVEAHHRQVNTAMWDPMRRWPDFSGVEAARERRRSTPAPPSSPIADRIFAAIERLGRPENENKAQLLAIQLGKLAVSIPHGDRRETVGKLLSLPQPIRAKRELLAALVMDGEVISADLVMQGVRTWIDEKNKNKHWMIDQHLWEVEGWLELLSFSDRPGTIVDAIAEVNTAIGREHEMERVVAALSHAPGDVAERVLGQLARQNRRLASPYHWESAIIRRGTASSTLLLVDLAAERVFGNGRGGVDTWSLSERLVPLVDALSEVKSELIRRYQAGRGEQSGTLIEHIFAKLGDVDCFMALVQGYAWQNKKFDGLLDMSIRDIALRKEPVEGSSGAYEYEPVAIAKLRKDLFDMLAGTPQEAALAEACLTAIDRLRDEHGSVASEPRHPDIDSGRPWPLAAGDTLQ